MSLRTWGVIGATAAVAIVSGFATSAHAGLTVTAAGAADGFSLTKFASGFQFGAGENGGVGPLGMAVDSAGQVIVDSAANGQNYVFNDVDGQTIATAISHTASPGYPPAYAYSNGAVWGSTGFGGRLVKLNNDGSLNTTYNNIPVSNGLWTNPVNGHLLGAGGAGIVDIDVSGATPTYKVVTGNGSDGVTVSPDGTIVYTYAIAGYKISDGSLVYGPFSVPDSSQDGMGVISGGALNGDIVVNTNAGNLYLLDALGSSTLIASGGSRGDYTAPDYTNGTLFVTQSDSIYRLALAGAGIGAPPPPPVTTPEPASLALLGMGLAALGFARRRKS